MSVPKVLKLVQSCGKCPHYGHYSGSIDKCSLADQTVRNKDVVAPFCPLPDFPGQIIADQAETIRVMREGNNQHFSAVVLSYIASKLSTPLDAEGRGIRIPLKEGKSLWFDPDYILETKFWPVLELKFRCEEQIYHLVLGPRPPKLQRRFKRPEIEKELWEDVSLA